MTLKQENFVRTESLVHCLGFIAFLLIAVASPIRGAAGGYDNSWHDNGRLATDFSDGVDFVTDVVVRPDGKVIVVGINGSITAGTMGPVAIARYNIDGSLDTTFSGDGKLVLTGNGMKAVVALSSTSTSIVVAYYTSTPATPSTLYVTRLHGSGAPDLSFDEDGTASDATVETFRLGAVTIDSSHRIIVVGGSSGSTPASDWLLWRFTLNGDRDTGFSGDGRQQTDFGGNSNEYATGVKVLSNGAMIVGGTGNPAGQGFALAKYTTNGSLDTNWGGGDGKVYTDITVDNDIPLDMDMQPDGRIVLGGSSRPVNGIPVGTIVRYHADGNLDNSFDGDGILQSASFGQFVQGVAVQVDGKVIGVGGATDFIIGRLNPNGTPDSDFGNAGFVVSDMNNSSDDEAKAVALSFDRRIVVAGSTLNTAAGSTRNFCVARYLPTNRPYHAPFDFDGDNITDFGIFRPSVGEWWYRRSSTGAVPAFQFGAGSDKIVPADYTGDGKTDIAVYRPASGEWFILRSENLSYFSFPFGAPTDIPVPADYDSDGKADPAVFRPSNGLWVIARSSDNGTTFASFGANGDLPVPADYDEDGKTDIAIYRPSVGQWWLSRTTAGVIAFAFGSSTDRTVPGDYTGDGKADVAFFRPATGEWYVLRSEDLSYYSVPYGILTDIPAPGDYDGDGRFDTTVVRQGNNAVWHTQRSTLGSLSAGFGVGTDRPIPNAFVR